MAGVQSVKPKVQVARTAIICVAIAASALSAGGILCFPLYAPKLVAHLKLNQPQLSTVALAGMSGQYLLAPLCGQWIDRYGPWATSLSASVLFASGWGWFAFEINRTTFVGPESPAWPFRRLVVACFLCGLATASSLFTTLFSASRLFPRHTGLSAGLSTAFFGLSPFILSYIASLFFSLPDGQLDVTHYVLFLGIFAGSTHFVCFILLKMLPFSTVPLIEHPDEESTLHPHEQTPLLANKSNTIVRTLNHDQSVRSLLKGFDFWLLLLSMFFLLGSCEMVMSNIGTIVLGVPVSPNIGPSTEFPGASTHRDDSSSTAPTQVRLLSLANTLSRLITGPLADYLAPVGLLNATTGALHFPSHRRFSRLLFPLLGTLVLALSYFWMATGVRTQQDIYAVSLSTGAAYGTVFTVLPSVVSALWLEKNAGRNYGLMMYAPFVGTPVFSYLYAFGAAQQKDGDEICQGVKCWKGTFAIAATAMVLTIALIAMLWKRARALV